jgi:hypothetical protein
MCRTGTHLTGDVIGQRRQYKWTLKVAPAAESLDTIDEGSTCEKRAAVAVGSTDCEGSDEGEDVVATPTGHGDHLTRLRESLTDSVRHLRTSCEDRLRAQCRFRRVRECLPPGSRRYESVGL